MNTLQVLRRLKAFEEGRALPRGETLHLPIAAARDTLILSFVRMGGESAPWGIAWGRPGQPPTVATVGEPRNRGFVADMLARFAPTLLEHVFHPRFSSHSITQPADPRPLRQLWLPNPTHLEMLHLLEFAYAGAIFGDPARAELLRTLGRACGWLFRESQRPGQTSVVVATDALRESFVFPSQDTRQGHLGFLLAWLDSGRDRAGRFAAAEEAERQTVATSLDPELERKELVPKVEAFNAARDEDAATLERAADAIQRALKPELVRRVELTQRTIDTLMRDKRRPNRGLDQLVKVSNEKHWYEYLRLERKIQDASGQRVFTPSPETDRNPVAAAARFYELEASAELRDSLLLHDDSELLEEALATGDAVRGSIADVRDEGEGRRTRPVWVIAVEPGSPVRFREGSPVCVYGLPKRQGRVRSLVSNGAAVSLEVEITSLVTDRGRDLPRGTRAAADPALRRSEVVLVKPVADGISFMKNRMIWKPGTPGAWLTGARSAEVDTGAEPVDPAVEATAVIE
jgi:hypothetical protein